MVPLAERKRRVLLANNSVCGGACPIVRRGGLLFGVMATAGAVVPGLEQVVELFQNQRYRKFKVRNADGACPLLMERVDIEKE